MPSEELKLCPFCGKAGERLEGGSVECANMNCFIAGILATPDEWNTRANSDLIEKVIAAVKGAGVVSPFFPVERGINVGINRALFAIRRTAEMGEGE